MPTLKFDDFGDMIKTFREEFQRLSGTDAEIAVVRGAITYRDLRIMLEGFRAFRPDIEIIYDPWMPANVVSILEKEPDGNE